MRLDDWIVLPESIAITHDWTRGRVFIGFQFIVSITVIHDVNILKLNEIWLELAAT